jgi:outer membrane protein assembly factor BamB
MKDNIVKILYTAAAILFVFMIFFGTLLYTEYTKIQKANPIKAEQLDTLKLDIKNPEISQAQLETIRELDFLHRRAWFSGQEHFKLGVKIIFICGILFAILLQLANVLQNPNKKTNLTKQQKATNSTLTISIVITSLLIIFLVIIISSEHSRIRNQGADTETAQVEEPDNASLTENVIWAGFRGLPIQKKAPTSNWTNTATWNRQWDIKPNLQGFSSPICTESKIFITGASSTELAIFCYAPENGNLIWELSTEPDFAPGKSMPEVTEDTGYAASTPVTDGQYIWAIFASGDLICSDMTGKLIWRKKLHVPDNMYGYSSSLLKYNNNLIVQYDDYEKQVLYNLDPDDGSIFWQKDREASISWATPTLIQTNNTDIISIVTSLTCEGYSLETGEEKWFHECMGGEVAPSSAYAGRYVINTCDNATTVAINPVNGEIIWQNDAIYMPDVACPIIIENMIYMFTSGATILCLDENTGKVLWEAEVPDGFYCSPISIEDKLIAINMQGKLYIIQADRERLNVIATKEFSQPIVTTPAIYKDSLIIRTFNQLMKIDLNKNN